ncbi:Histone-lysine N-methyltransferase ATXR2 [Dendrobium catenatum]|uniref:Histone-lysine N-methyltransferase ATXR2 n=1 Tax=Dendrobium catenatum TaxID=906689 RepID=A0A2I0WMM9_9ASPA|nr:Histone-lysine N-methyltransferase ATXR2 [Dendrobium catenatum]
MRGEVRGEEVKNLQWVGEELSMRWEPLVRCGLHERVRDGDKIGTIRFSLTGSKRFESELHNFLKPISVLRFSGRTAGSNGPNLVHCETFFEVNRNRLADQFVVQQFEYYEGLIQKEKCHAVRIEINTEHGKGVFSNRKFEEEELIFKDQILVAAQHSSNKVDCFVCSSCFRFIGSVELQIGRKLYLQSLGLLVKKECCHQTFSNEKTASSSSESQNEDDLLFQENSDNAGQSSYGENSPSKEVLESLMNEKLSLPFSKQFSLPSIVPCPGGCEEEYYCSKVCADSNWESMHSLLCTGKSSCSLRQAAIVKFTEHANIIDVFVNTTSVNFLSLQRCISADLKRRKVAAYSVYYLCLRTEMSNLPTPRSHVLRHIPEQPLLAPHPTPFLMHEFHSSLSLSQLFPLILLSPNTAVIPAHLAIAEHSNRSSPSRRTQLSHPNFCCFSAVDSHLAAVCSTIWVRRLKQSLFENSKRPSSHNSTNDCNLSLLLEAWKPIAMGFKRRWRRKNKMEEKKKKRGKKEEKKNVGKWKRKKKEVERRGRRRRRKEKGLPWMAAAEAGGGNREGEGVWLSCMRKCTSLLFILLLVSVLVVFAAVGFGYLVFSLEIYGHIIDMFELNNLDLVVASPVENYFLYIDELPSPEKEEAEKLTRPFLDALGTAFYPIQSCINHSCCPNAKAFKREEDIDGHTVIIAVNPISIGEEITISYIDEDLPYEERQALLADYGFKCSCRKCRKEQSSR